MPHLSRWRILLSSGLYPVRSAPAPEVLFQPARRLHRGGSACTERQGKRYRRDPIRHDPSSLLRCRRQPWSAEVRRSRCRQTAVVGLLGTVSSSASVCPPWPLTTSSLFCQVIEPLVIKRQHSKKIAAVTWNGSEMATVQPPFAVRISFVGGLRDGFHQSCKCVPQVQEGRFAFISRFSESRSIVCGRYNGGSAYGVRSVLSSHEQNGLTSSQSAAIGDGGPFEKKLDCT